MISIGVFWCFVDCLCLSQQNGEYQTQIQESGFVSSDAGSPL